MGDDIPEGELEDVKMPYDLFRLMMQHGILSETNLDRLHQLLVNVKRNDVALKLHQMKGKQ